MFCSIFSIRRLLVIAILTLAVAANVTPVVRAQAPTVVTYEKVLEYLTLDVAEAKIIKLVAASPTMFTLGADQLQQLRAAGATDALLAAMQKPGQAVALGSDVTDFVLILDCSGSMTDRVPGGTTKWDAARKAAIDLINSIPEGRNLALLVYGHDVARACQAIDVLRPLGALNAADKANLATAINALHAVGQTPIANTLRRAGSELSRATGMAEIILITDGMESCKGDPAAAAAKLVQQFPNLKGGVNVIGFCLSPAEAAQVERIAKAGAGKYFDAQNAQQLVETVKTIERRIAKPAPVMAVVAEEDVENLSGVSVFDLALIEQLNDAALETRETAAKLLGERNVVAAGPALMKLINSPHWETYSTADHEAALVSLLKLNSAQAGRALSRVFDHDKYEARRWAGAAMGEFKVAAAAPAAVARLASGNVNVYFHEAEKIAAGLQVVAPEQLQTTLLVLMKHPNAELKSWAAKTLSEAQR